MFITMVYVSMCVHGLSMCVHGLSMCVHGLSMCVHGLCVASFPGLPTVQFLINCSPQSKEQARGLIL